MTLGLHPDNSATTVRNLALLADEMCHTVGLSHTDINWYVDRTIVGGVYAAAEIFMLTDKSKDFQDTSEFVKRRVSEAYRLSSPQSSATPDERLKAVLSCLPHMSKPIAKGIESIIQQAGAKGSQSTASLLTSSASMVLNTLSSILPAGYPPQRDSQTNPRKGTSYKPPKEEDVASREEIEKFDEKNDMGLKK
jgi:hypothetical protein